MKQTLKHITQKNSFKRLFVWGIVQYLKFVRITTRWQVIQEGNMPDTPKIIFTCWHARILMTPLVWSTTPFANTPLNFIVSPSKDGDILNLFLSSFGYIPLVGSSGSGTGFLPFKNAIKILKQGKPFAIAPDGSRGPRYKMKDGLGFLALKQNAPIIVFTFNTNKRKVLNSWDKMIVPLPFSKGIIILKVITVDSIQKDSLNDFLEQELTDLTHRSDMYFDHS